MTQQHNVSIQVDAAPLLDAIRSATEVLEHVSELGQAGFDFIQGARRFLLDGDVCTATLAGDGIVVLQPSEAFAILMSTPGATDRHFMASKVAHNQVPSTGCISKVTKAGAAGNCAPAEHRSTNIGTV